MRASALLLALVVPLAGCTDLLDPGDDDDGKPASTGPAMEAVSAETDATKLTVAFYATAGSGRALSLVAADFVLRGSDGTSAAATTAGLYNATSAGLKPGGTTIPAAKTRLGFATFAKPASTTANYTLRWTANETVIQAAVPKISVAATALRSISLTQTSCGGAAPVAKFNVVSVSAGFPFAHLRVTDATTGRSTDADGGASTPIADSTLGLSVAGAPSGNIAAGDAITITSGDANDMTCTDTLNFVDHSSGTLIALLTLHT